MLHLLKETFF